MDNITFHTRPWTLRDALMAQRIERNPQDIEAMIALLVSRSDATEADIMALPLSSLAAVMEQLTESLNITNTLTILSATWNIPNGEGDA